MSRNQQFGEFDIERLAALAHVQLSESEKILFARQLADILAYARQMQALDTAAIPMMSPYLAGNSVLRDDVPGQCLDRDRALSNAPETSDGFFKVPRILG